MKSKKGRKNKTKRRKEYKTNKYTCDNNYTGKNYCRWSWDSQSNLLEIIVKFNNKSKLRLIEDKKKRYSWKFICSLWRSRINS